MKRKKSVFLTLTFAVAIFFSPKLQAQNIACTVNSGGQPTGLVFDGHAMWVANFSQNNVRKIQLSNCAVLGTYSVESGPFGLAFDGTNIWVANYYSNTVTKLNATTGALVGTYAVGHGPRKLTFDGTNIWVANQNSNTVTKLLASTGALLGTFTVGSVPYDVVFDGTYLYVSSSDKVTVMDTAGTILTTASADSGTGGMVIAPPRNGLVYVSCYNAKLVDVLGYEPPNLFEFYQVNMSAFSYPLWLATDGSYAYAVTHGGYLTQLAANSPGGPIEVVNSWVIQSGYHLLGIAYDPVDFVFWVTAVDEGYTYKTTVQGFH